MPRTGKRGIIAEMKLFHHAEFEQAVLQAAQHFRAQDGKETRMETSRHPLICASDLVYEFGSSALSPTTKQTAPTTYVFCMAELWARSRFRLRLVGLTRHAEQ